MNKQELLDIICNLFGITECTSMILNHINKYVTERGYSYKNIARALVYYVDVLGNTPQLQYGLGIVPYVIKDAVAYYEEKRKQKEQQLQAAYRNKNAETVTIHVPTDNRVTIRRKTIDIDKL